MDTDDERGKTPDTEVEMDDNRASRAQARDRIVTGAYSAAKVNAPEGSKRHQTYYDSESTPPCIDATCKSAGGAYTAGTDSTIM